MLSADLDSTTLLFEQPTPSPKQTTTQRRKSTLTMMNSFWSPAHHPKAHSPSTAQQESERSRNHTLDLHS